MLNHPTGLFRETIVRPLGGAGPSNFYTPYNSLKCISSRTWGAGRPHVGLCPIFLVYFFNQPRDLRAPSADRHETLRRDHYLLQLDNPVLKIRGPFPKKIWGQKHAKFGPILHNFRLWSRISPEQDKISKIGTTHDLERFLPRSAKYVRWTLVHYQ